ncbi:hypothetical protein, partial [Burkholderia sp. 9777_1386]|uniref:hypothetical protein n=1 Tax=Burkholderia sp. 9777_1386 TaxID=2751183 RepID=UPI001E45FCD5
TTDLQGDMVGDRQDGAATAAPSDKKLGKITSTKVGSIYPTLTRGADGISGLHIGWIQPVVATLDC